MVKKKKFKAIVTHPIQYHAVLWRELNKLDNLDFEVYFLSDHGQKVSVDKDFGVAFKWDVPLKEGYKSRTFKNYGFGNGFFKYINPALLLLLLTHRSEIVYFHGVSNFTAYFAFLISKLKGQKTIIRNIAHLQDFSSYGGPKFLLKDMIFGTVFRLASVCLYIGKHNKDFYKRFRVKETSLVHAPHVVDNQFFQSRKLTHEEGIKLKEELEIELDSVVLVFCGKLIPKKQPLMLLNAFANSRLNKRASLLFVGEGVLGDKLKRNAEEINESKNKQVSFLGFKNQSQLPPLYSITDVLILPSFHEETWGLVVNEALNLSSSIIVSDNVGCGPNLVEGKTGYVFDRNKEDELQKAIETLVNSEAILNKFKNNALSLINRWSVVEYIESVKRIINE